MLINASREVEKGDPKNFINDGGIKRIATTFLKWKQEDKFSQVVEKAEIEKNDFNISPSRYVHTAEVAELRPLDEIVSELSDLREVAEECDATLNQILVQLGAAQ